MRQLIKRKNFWIIFGIDLLLLCLAYFLSYFIRFEGKIPADELSNFKNTVWLIVPFKILLFFKFNLYRGMWRYTGINDLINLVKSVFVGSTVIILAILYLHRFEGYPRSVFAIDGFLTLIFIGGIRLTVRLAHQKRVPSFGETRRFPYFRDLKEDRKRLLIIGAGDAGEKILREFQDNPRLKYEVVGFADDDSTKQGMQIHGVPVLGEIDQLSDLVKEYEVQEILIAIAAATRKEIRQIVNLCTKTACRFRIIPGMGELIDGNISFKTVREVSYEDLLGRDPVNLDTGSIGNYLAGKTILITGAGGSIGSELCRQIAKFNPKNLILFDKTENNLFHIEMEFRHRFQDIAITPILGNLQHWVFLEKLFLDHKPQVVFHAAAFKHVPIVELNPWEAIFNNIVGTQNIGEASHRFGVERFIMVSTDKAVKPFSVMGATKRVAEMTTCCYGASTGSRFVSVRFGNVIGSEGSVVHLFKRQIEQYGPITVTHPEMTRYFMTIPEACKLILQAAALGEGGEIFILDMGTPIKIDQMARDLIRLSGFEPDADIEIKYIGLRPGEKLYEELITEGEGIVRTPHEKIFVLRGNHFDHDWLNKKIEELVHLAWEQDAGGIKAKLKEIIPEYQPYQEK